MPDYSEASYIANSCTDFEHFQLSLGKTHKGKAVPTMNVLTFKELHENKKFYLAMCLELDIVAQGDSRDDSLKELAEVLQTHIEFAEENNTELYRPAPKDYWDKLHEIQANEIKQRLAS